MGLPRSPAPATSEASTEHVESGRASSSHPPASVAATSAATGAASSPVPDIVRFFCQEADRLHTAATILQEVTEDMLRDGFRQLSKSKTAIDAANVAGSISKNSFLGAEKHFNQTRTAVLHKVKSLNPQIKNLTDLLRPDVAVREAQHTSGKVSRRPPSARRRSTSRSPHMLSFSPSTGFRPIQPQTRGRSAPTELLYSAPPSFGTATSAALPIANPLVGASASFDPAWLSGPCGPLILQGLLYQQQQAQSQVQWEPWTGQPVPPPARQDPRRAAAQDPNLGPLLSVISRRENIRGDDRAAATDVRVIGEPRSVINDTSRSSAAVIPGAIARDEEEAYFAREYGGEQLDLRLVQFPEGWRYPSDRVFDIYFAKTDFMKAKKAGILKTFDGTVAGYPDFRLAFYKHVHVQRAPLLDKITTLDSLVPGKFFQEHFKGLDLTVHDYRLRIERLERLFRGDKRQLEHLLTKVGEFLKNPSGRSAEDLQGFVYSMESHFKKPSTHAAQKEVLATFLQVALPDTVRLEYHTFLTQDGKEETPENFMSFLQHKIDAQVRSAQQKRVFFEDKKALKKGKILVGMNSTDDGDQNGEDPGVAGSCHLAGNSAPCTFCKSKPHPLFRCFRFASAPHEQKIQFVKTEGRCMKCLRTGHMAKECTQVISCDFCENPFGAGHNRLLHKDPDAQIASAEGKIPAYAHRAERQLSGSRPIAAASMVLYLRCPETGREVAINALPDTGATDFILDTSVADRLSLKGDPCKYTVLGHAGHETEHECIMGQISAVEPKTKQEFPLNFFAYGGPCEGMYPEDWSKLKGNWAHLKDLDLPAPVGGRPFEAIVGCRYLSLLEPVDGGNVHKGTKSEDPLAKLTPLGWVVAGKTSSKAWGRVSCMQGLAVPASGTIGDGRPPDYRKLYCQLKKDLERVWNLESESEMKRLANCYSPPIKTVAEARVETQFKENLEFIEEEGRYQARLAWGLKKGPIIITRKPRECTYSWKGVWRHLLPKGRPFIKHTRTGLGLGTWKR